MIFKYKNIEFEMTIESAEKIIQNAEENNDGYFDCAFCPLDERCVIYDDCSFVLLCAHRVIVGNLNQKIINLVEENGNLTADNFKMRCCENCKHRHHSYVCNLLPYGKHRNCRDNNFSHWALKND